MAKKLLKAGRITSGRLSGVRFQCEITPTPNLTQHALAPILNEREFMPEIGDVYEVTIKLKNTKGQARKSKL